DRVPVDRQAARALVRGEERLALAEPADGRIGAEAPRANAHPRQVFERIAHVRELPVENGTQALGPEDDVAESVVAVHDGERARRRTAGREPAERELERRMRI